ncbi:hypothetical protein ACFVYR_25865 [Streptomyces sp. NPDC058284]|uniref:hypothetical protein n=1 Tax=unclassified Streptomyces TaxID=2593676 RepID=UPI00365FED28
MVSALLAVASYHFVFGATPSWDVRAVAAAVLVCAALSLCAASPARTAPPDHSALAARPAPRLAPQSSFARAGRSAARRWSRRTRDGGTSVARGGRPLPTRPTRSPGRPSRPPLTAWLAHTVAVDSGRELRLLYRSLVRTLRLLCAFLARVLRPARAPRAAVLPRPARAPHPGRPTRATPLTLLLAGTVVRRGPPARPPLAV